jgi:hypothetical protein
MLFCPLYWGLTSCLFPPVLFTKPHAWSSLLLPSTTFPSYRILLDLINRLLFGDSRVMKRRFMHLSPVPITSSVLGSSIFVSTLSPIPSTYVLYICVVNQVSNPHKTIGKITVQILCFSLSCILSQYIFISSIDRKLMCFFLFQSLLFHLVFRNGIFKAKLKSNRHKASLFFIDLPTHTLR